MELLADPRSATPEELLARPHSRALSLEEVLPILASPDTGRPLSLDRDKNVLSDTVENYRLLEGLPLLIPARLRDYFTHKLEVPFAHYSDPFRQYFLMASIKQGGEVNAPANSQAANLHFFRASEFLSDCEGLLLDVGCDDPTLGASLVPVACRYVGLDPFCARTEPFRVIGVGEYLPFLDGSVDNVLFNTSLDHILDWRRAIDEAFRVLKPGGSLYLFSYVWTDRADLVHDIVHFHHFRDYEFYGKLAEMGVPIKREARYVCPKNDTHRHAFYLRAVKP